LRERNSLLLAAGFAPAYGETDLASPEAAQARWALQLMLRRHEPFAAVAFDRRWTVLMANAPWLRLASRAEPTLGKLAPCEVILPLRLRLGDLRARLFSTSATLGTAQDVTLQELRIEAFYPADAESDAVLRALAPTST
jgi:hypothetical protein